MARRMPRLVAYFAQNATEAVALANAGDVALAASRPGTHLRSEWYVTRVEYLYEVAFLRLFSEWELFLERTFFRYLCGYVSTRGCPVSVTGGYYGTLALAEQAVLGGRDFVLWHNPNAVAT